MSDWTINKLVEKAKELGVEVDYQEFADQIVQKQILPIPDETGHPLSILNARLQLVIQQIQETLNAYDAGADMEQIKEPHRLEHEALCAKIDKRQAETEEPG